MKSVAIVLGTYNRLACLQRAIASIRCAVGPHPYQIVVVDGGSTDGTREYLLRCYDVHMIPQSLPLKGAVRAFNEGFGYAVDQRFDYVMHLNDDAEILSAGWERNMLEWGAPIAMAIYEIERDKTIGEVAFQFDLRGDWGYDRVNGVPYANFGVIRREVGEAVAQKQGDPTGRAWWNPIYRTYGADTEFGCWIWDLGYRVHLGSGRVHDTNRQDAMRAENTGHNKHGDGERFWARWRDKDLSRHLRKFPGLYDGHVIPAPEHVVHPPPPVSQASKRRGRAGNCPR